MNNPPAPTAPDITTDIGIAGSSQIAANDPNAGDTFTYAVTTAATHGTATVNAAGLASYTPNSGFSGTDSFVVTVTDQGGLIGTVTINVTVSAFVAPDTTAPVITMLGQSSVIVTQGAVYTDAGATATDAVDGDLTASITVNNSVNTSVIGSYTVTYGVTDTAGNPAMQVVRTVNVVAGSTSPVEFTAAVNFGPGGGPRSVTSADFNSDGKPDLAVANYSFGVSILLGDGAGGFAAAVNFAAGMDPFSVTSADFNNDGKPDLAVANRVSNDVSVLLGDGVGGFTPAVNYTAGTDPRSVISADFNNDGKPDLAVANQISNDVSILLGDGTGGFAAAVNFAAGTDPISVTSADFNGDGKPDLAVANAFSTVSACCWAMARAVSRRR